MDIVESKKSGSREYAITFSDVEIKAFEGCVSSVIDWIRLAVQNRLNICIDQVYEELSEFQASKKPTAEKLDFLSTKTIETKASKDLAEQAKLIEIIKPK